MKQEGSDGRDVREKQEENRGNEAIRREMKKLKQGGGEKIDGRIIGDRKRKTEARKQRQREISCFSRQPPG